MGDRVDAQTWRRLLVDTLIYHQRTDDGCACGWSEWGQSHAEHVVDVFTMVLSELRVVPGG